MMRDAQAATGSRDLPAFAAPYADDGLSCLHPGSDDRSQYVACAGRPLTLRDRIVPQFATHNALTVAEVVDCAGGLRGF